MYAYVRAREVLNRSQPTILKAPSRHRCEAIHAPTALGRHSYGFRDRSWGKRSQFGPGMVPRGAAYGGYTYAVLDLFFIARVATFAGLKQGDDVVEVVTPAARDVRAEELAFLSMQQAWREVLHGPAKFIPA